MLNRPALIYLAGALLATSAVLGVTLWLYIAASRPTYEIFSAAVVNAAATLAASTFVGVFDMFFTLQQMRRNQEDNRRWEDLVAQMQKDRESDREERRAEREERQVEREENRQLMERLLTLLERGNGTTDAAAD